MNPSRLLIAASIAASLGFGSAWQLQAHTITKINLDAANERINLQRTVRTNAERHIKTVKVAQDKAQVKLAVVVGQRKRLSADLDSLRNISEASLRAAEGSIDSCVVDATAKTELFAHCSGRLVEVSAAADGHVIDIEALTTAWPK